MNWAVREVKVDHDFWDKYEFIDIRYKLLNTNGMYKSHELLESEESNI